MSEKAGIRAILNYGHTFGHAIETVAGYGNFIHGDAVAIGMLMAGELACSLNMMKRSELQKIVSLWNELNLCNSTNTLDPGAIFQAMSKDKKVMNGNLHFVLPEKIGKVSVISNIDKNLIIDAIKKYT